MHAQQQSGGSDCGLFAIANATEICFGLHCGDDGWLNEID